MIILLAFGDNKKPKNMRYLIARYMRHEVAIMIMWHYGSYELLRSKVTIR